MNELKFIISSLAEQNIAKLRSDGFRIFLLGGIDSAISFFQRVKMVLPLDPPLSGKVNWNAFVDSLWSGIDALPDSQIAICWLDADLMLCNDPIQFRTAIDCMSDVINDFAADKHDSNQQLIKLIVRVFGEGGPFETAVC